MKWRIYRLCIRADNVLRAGQPARSADVRHQLAVRYDVFDQYVFDLVEPQVLQKHTQGRSWSRLW
ncbi:hypothetical protein OHB54_03400 [Streptomyces sp. NBC_01007]|nr:hypothetical protein OHB54_03400 [Streptomyces sp. NBC_01007]